MGSLGWTRRALNHCAERGTLRVEGVTRMLASACQAPTHSVVLTWLSFAQGSHSPGHGEVGE